MTNEQTTALGLKDSAGEYYLLPREALERGRVPAEHKAEVERLISELDDDVQGHAAVEGGFVAFFLALSIGFAAGSAYKNPIGRGVYPAMTGEEGYTPQIDVPIGITQRDTIAGR